MARMLTFPEDGVQPGVQPSVAVKCMYTCNSHHQAYPEEWWESCMDHPRGTSP